jgi:hypothetical protein
MTQRPTSLPRPRAPLGEGSPTDSVEAEIEKLNIDEEGHRRLANPTSAAAELGRLGGAARARKLTAEQRTEIARKAAARRWRKPD